jgi:hypothetical protein
MDACTLPEPLKPVEVKPVVVTPVVVKPVDSPPHPSDPGRTIRRAGAIAMIAGGASLAIGSYLAVRAHQDQVDREALCVGTPCPWNQTLQARADDLDASGQTASHWAIATLAVGGAAVLTGAVAYVLHRAPPEHLAITPTGATVSFRF